VKKQAGRFLVFLMIAGLCACSTTYKLSMSDAGYPLLENTPLDVLQQHNVNYLHIGSDRFDTFFKESALLYASFVVGRNLTMDVTKNLKNFARSRMAKGQLSQNGKELLNGRDPDSLSSEETVALLQLEKKQGAMTGDEVAYMGKAVLNLGGAALSMGKAVQSAAGLIKTGTDLLANIKSELSIFGIPKFWIISGAVKGTKQSLAQLKEVNNEAPALVKEIAVLSQGIQLLMAADTAEPAVDAAAPADSPVAEPDK
jgi:hypothetical protein